MLITKRFSLALKTSFCGIPLGMAGIYPTQPSHHGYSSASGSVGGEASQSIAGRPADAPASLTMTTDYSTFTDRSVPYPSPKRPATPSTYGVTTPPEADADMYREGLTGKLEGRILEFAVEALLGDYDHHIGEYHAANVAVHEFNEKQPPGKMKIPRLERYKARKWAESFFANPHSVRNHIRQHAASLARHRLNKIVQAHEQEANLRAQGDPAEMALPR
jgi:hypothetical protein